MQVADGLILEKVTCPLGVLLVVFESRPDALVQVDIKYHYIVNSCILKHLCTGGKLISNQYISDGLSVVRNVLFVVTSQPYWLAIIVKYCRQGVYSLMISELSDKVTHFP